MTVNSAVNSYIALSTNSDNCLPAFAWPFDIWFPNTRMFWQSQTVNAIPNLHLETRRIDRHMELHVELHNRKIPSPARGNICMSHFHQLK